MTHRPSKAPEPTQEAIIHKLEEAIARVRADMATVELWAAALSGFAQPVPSYKPDDNHLLPQAMRPHAHHPR
jgi:hypothetical protein